MNKKIHLSAISLLMVASSITNATDDIAAMLYEIAHDPDTEIAMSLCFLFYQKK